MWQKLVFKVSYSIKFNFISIITVLASSMKPFHPEPFEFKCSQSQVYRVVSSRSELSGIIQSYPKSIEAIQIQVQVHSDSEYYRKRVKKHKIMTIMIFYD